MDQASSQLDENELELYCLGRATSLQLAPLEHHLMQCPLCITRAQACLEYIDSLRAALRRIEESPATETLSTP